MTKFLFTIILTQLLLILGGYGLMQLSIWGQRLQFWSWLPFYWGVGALLLYLIGSFFVLTDLFLNSWHWIVGAIYFGVIGLALWRRYTLDESQIEPDVNPHRIQWSWPHYLLIALIASKIMLVCFINIHNPVIDSDATDASSYVSMSQKIGAGLSRNASREHVGLGLSSPLAPSVLAAWPRLFIDRWHNHAASIPWLFCYLSILGAVFFFSRQIVGNFTLSLVTTYVFSAIPLIANHTIRPGFQELLVCYFIMVAFGATAVFIRNHDFHNVRPKFGLELLLIIVGIFGAFLSKAEGKLWAVLLCIIIFSYVINTYKNITWPKIIGGQILLVVPVFILWYIFGEWLFSGEIFSGSRSKQLAPTSFNPQAWRATLDVLFTWGSFNVIWWLTIVATLVTFLYAETQTKVFVLYLLAILAFLIFFANFTKNQVFTIQGTTFGRFLHQLMVIPLLIILFAADAVQKKKLVSTV